jgi:hypothetical protein
VELVKSNIHVIYELNNLEKEWDKIKTENGLNVLILHTNLDENYDKYFHDDKYSEFLNGLVYNLAKIFILEYEYTRTRKKPHPSRPWKTTYINKLANNFDIPKKDIPCIVFFGEIDSTKAVWKTIKIKQKDLKKSGLTFEVTLSEMLKEIFTHVKNAIKDGHTQTEILSNLEREFKIAKVKRKIKTIFKRHDSEYRTFWNYIIGSGGILGLIGTILSILNVIVQNFM